MCSHVFVFPDDLPENYNTDGKTLTGQCKCGATQKAYGMRVVIPMHEQFNHFNPYEMVSFKFDSGMFLDKWNSLL